MSNNQATDEREPLKLKYIVPLLGAILILVLIFAFLQSSKPSFSDLSGDEIAESFTGHVAKIKDREHHRLFMAHKKVLWDQGMSQAEFLNGISGSELISTISLQYQIPVFINLTGEWLFSFKENEFQVQSPMPSFGEPAFDPSTLDVTFKSDLPDEQKSVIKDALKENLAGFRVDVDAPTNKALEGESRQNVQSFLETWINSNYKSNPDLKYQITFSGSQNSDNTDEP